MEATDLSLNEGTVASGEAAVPRFSIQASNLSPAVNEPIELTVLLTTKRINMPTLGIKRNLDGRVLYLNRRTISKTFTSNGQHVIRVVVSDMKGGVSSRNLIIRVGPKEETATTLVSGRVRSNKGPGSGSQSFAQESLSIVEHQLSGFRYFCKILESRVPKPIICVLCHRQRRSQTTDHASRRNSSFLPGPIQRRQSALLSLIVRTMSLPK